MTKWRAVFGSNPTTVRKAVEKAGEQSHLKDAMREFPVEERGEINPSKLGWVIKKNADRVVGGRKFKRAEADGLTAWCVVDAKTPPLPPLPPLEPSVTETVSGWIARI